MRILIATKRRYSDRDLIGDRFGRLFELPRALVRRGHEVEAVVLSYRPLGDRRVHRFSGIRWHAVDWLPDAGYRWRRRLDERISHFRPDLVWVASDAFHVIAGRRLKQAFGVPVVADLYDDFESFGATRLPGVRARYRQACREMDGLSVVSHHLRHRVVGEWSVRAPVTVVENGVDAERFRPGDRFRARRGLGLPEHARLIGTAGALTASRGIGDLLGAFERLAAEDPALHLVVAGPGDRVFRRFSHPRLIYLGRLPQQRVPEFYVALDLAVVCNRDSAFGRACFPMKFYEALACGTPVVAAAVGDVETLLAGVPGACYPPGDVAALADAIRCRIGRPAPPALEIPLWERLGERLETLFQEVVEGRGRIDAM